MQNALKEIASTEPNCYLNSEKYSWLIKQELSYSVVLNYPCTLTYFSPIDTFMITFLLILILKHRIIPKIGSPVYNPIPLLFENKRTFLWSFSPCILQTLKNHSMNFIGKTNIYGYRVYFTWHNDPNILFILQTIFISI